MRRSRLPPSALIGAPLVLLLIGAGAGWFMRDTAGSSDGETVVTVVGGTVPDDLDQFVPQQRIATPPNPVIIDPASIIGFQPVGTLDVPPTDAVDLPLNPDDTASVVDAITHLPATATSPTPRAAVSPSAVSTLTALATPESTLPPPRSPASDTGTATTIEQAAFSDPCLTATTPCAGVAAVVTADASSSDAALDPLQISIPVGGEGFSAQCDEIQQGNVPDPALSPATRPTVVVLVNQPSTLALTGEWVDGTAVGKTTMITSPADDAEWKRSWDQDRVQRHIVACLTLPVDAVRPHSSAGVGELRADILAISATGRADISGQVTLNTATDGDDAFFAEHLVIADRGEQRHTDGLLYPTVHVHYAFLTDAVVAPGSGLDPGATHVYGEHAFIEGADCNGWADNKQGRDRTSGAQLKVTIEQRSVAGRARNVTVVDGEVSLDPTMPSGWEGQFCVRLIATDRPPGTPGAASPDPLTLALSGTTLRAPRTSDYAISVLSDDAAGDLHATWTTPAGASLCTRATLNSDAPGASCAVSARFAADGVWVVVGSGDNQLVSALVPINTAYCNTDDPYGSLADGCSRGFTQPLEIPNGDGTNVRVTLQVQRTADAGMLWQDPSNAWLIGPLTSFIT